MVETIGVSDAGSDIGIARNLVAGGSGEKSRGVNLRVRRGKCTIGKTGCLVFRHNRRFGTTFDNTWVVVFVGWQHKRLRGSICRCGEGKEMKV